MIEIRPLRAGDSFEELTDLLHRAYAPLAEAGMKFVASHQSVQTTVERCERGSCFVAEQNGVLVGTITLYPPSPESECQLYRDPTTFHFGQFAVDPDLQSKGVGRQLLVAVERSAIQSGATTLALDTSENATQLIRMYEHLGFKIVDRIHWGDIVNYASVIMSKPIGG